MPNLLVTHPPPGVGLQVLAALLVSGAAPASWSEPTPTLALDGYATYYAPGLMERVARNRGISLAGYAGGVALNRAGDLGREVWLQWGYGDVDGPYLAIDCAQFEHFGERQRLARVVEVDAQTAQRRGFYGVGPVPVRVLLADPAKVSVTPFTISP
jgi:hypothetical protein